MSVSAGGIAGSELNRLRLWIRPRRECIHRAILQGDLGHHALVAVDISNAHRDPLPERQISGELLCPRAERLGRDAFLARYGFGRARDYFLFLNGKRYDHPPLGCTRDSLRPAAL